MAMAGGVFLWQANASTGEVTRAPLYVNVPRRRNYIPDLFPNLAVLAVLAGGIPHPAPEPQLTRRIAPQPDLSPNIALRLTAGLNIPALFEPPVSRKAQSPELFPNLAIATQAPVTLIPAYAEPAQNRRTGLQPEIWPNLAVNLQTLMPRGTPEPMITRRLPAAPELYPNLAASAPLALVQINEPIEPWTNKRFPPQVEVFQNQALYAPAALQTFPTSTDATDTKAWHWSYIAYAPDVLPNIAVAFTNVPAPPPPVVDQTPAGRHRTHRRLYVQIDGQDFPVESAEHAQALLDRAKVLALEVAPRKAERKLTAHLESSPTQRPKIEKPRITSSNPELQEMIKVARGTISKIYSNAYIETEIRLRLLAQDADDEDDLFLLL